MFRNASSIGIVVLLAHISLGRPSTIAADVIPENAIQRLGRLNFRAQLSDRWGRAVSRNGRFMAVIPSCDPSMIDVYDLASGARTMSVCGSAGKDLSGQIKFSNDASELLAVDGSKWLIGWDMFSRRRTGAIECENPRSFAISADGRVVAVSVDGGIDLREWPSGKRLRLLADTRDFEDVSFSNTGDRLLGIGQHWWSIWKVSDGIRLVDHTQESHPNGIQRMYGFSPNLEIGACLHQAEYGVVIFNSIDGKTLRTVQIPEGPRQAVLLGNTGQIAITRDGESLSIEIIDVMTGKAMRTLQGNSEHLYQLIASSDGSTLVGFSATRQWVWNCESGVLREYCLGHAAISRIVFSPDGRIVATTGPSIELHVRAPLLCVDGTKYWDWSSGKLLHEAPNCLFGMFSKDGQHAWMWTHAGEIQNIDMRTFHVVSRSAVVRNDRNRLNIVDRIREPTATPEKLWRWQPWHEPSDATVCAASLCRSQVGSYLEPTMIATAWKDVLTIPRSLPPFDTENAQIEEIAMSANGTTLAYEYVWYPGSRRRTEVGIERVDNQKTIWLGSDALDVERPAVSADGSSVIAFAMRTTNDDDDTIPTVEEVRLWSAADGTLVAHWNVRELNIRPATAVAAMSHDRKLFAIGTADGQVRIWATDRPNSAALAVASGHEGAITALAFSKDDRLMATGSADSTVLIIDLRRLLVGTQ